MINNFIPIQIQYITQLVIILLIFNYRPHKIRILMILFKTNLTCIVCWLVYNNISCSPYTRKNVRLVEKNVDKDDPKGHCAKDFSHCSFCHFCHTVPAGCTETNRPTSEN